MATIHSLRTLSGFILRIEHSHPQIHVCPLKTVKDPSSNNTDCSFTHTYTHVNHTFKGVFTPWTLKSGENNNKLLISEPLGGIQRFFFSYI